MPYNLRESHQLLAHPPDDTTTLLFNHKSASFSAPQQFLSLDEVQLISQKLHLPSTRISALQSLSSEEALHNAFEHWELLKSGLRSCLVIPKTSSLSLAIHLRLMKYDHQSAKESYVSMTEALMEMYESSSIQEQGATILRALVDYNRALPSSWIRFPESYIEEMISSFMKLLSILPKRDKVVPLQIMCMVDPGSGWIREWFLSDFGRSIFLKSMPRNLLIYFSQESVGMLKGLSSAISRARNGGLDEPLLSYSVFLTSINFICQCLKFKKSRQKLIYELGAQTPLSIFTEIIEFLLYNRSSSTGPLEYIAKSLGEVIAFNRCWIIQDYFIETKLLSKMIHSLSPSSRYICMVLKEVYLSRSTCLLVDEDNRILEKFCISAFQSCTKEDETMLDVIELSLTYLSLYPKSTQEFAQPLVYQMCRIAFKASEEKLQQCINTALVDIFLANPIHAKTIAKYNKDLLVSLFKSFEVLRSHPRVWAVDLELCISEGYLNLMELTNIEDESLDPWDERSPWDLAHRFEKLLGSVSASNAPGQLLTHLEELVESKFRLLTSLAYLSLDFYVFLEVSYNLRQKYGEISSDMGHIIDEDSLRLKYFLRYTESLGSLREKGLKGLSIHPDSYVSLRRIDNPCVDEEQNEGEEENDFLRILEILEEDADWLSNARDRFESIPPDVSLSRRTLLKVFDRTYPPTPESKSGTQMNMISSTTMSVILSLFRGYKEIMDKSTHWENELKELSILFSREDVFNWHMASLYFSTRSFEMTKRVLSAEDFAFCRERFHYASEMILFYEDPLLYAFLNQRFILPSLIFEKWVMQSFFNILPWREVRRSLVLVPLFGFRYMLFLCIAIFRHHRLDLLKDEDEPLGVNFNEGISLFSVSEDFRIGHYLPYMKLLDEKYDVSLKSPE